MMFAIASLRHRPISPTSFSPKPADAASASTDLRTDARCAGSLATVTSSRPGMVMGRMLTCLITVAPIGLQSLVDSIKSTHNASKLHLGKLHPEETSPMGLIVPLPPLHDRFLAMGGVFIVVIPECPPG